MSIVSTFDANKNILTIGDSRIVFHCHHYNLFLQRTIEDALGEHAAPLQVRAATEGTRRLLSPVFAQSGDFASRLMSAASFFAGAGFGQADIADLSSTGGVVRLVTSHYAVGWRAKWGVAQRPVCHFPTGFWAAAFGAARDLPAEQVSAAEERCAGVSEGPCLIRIGVN